MWRTLTGIRRLNSFDPYKDLDPTFYNNSRSFTMEQTANNASGATDEGIKASSTSQTTAFTMKHSSFRPRICLAIRGIAPKGSRHLAGCYAARAAKPTGDFVGPTP